MHQQSIQQMSTSKQWHYAIGQLGWATLINIINLQLVYFYIPPEGANLTYFIPQVTFLAVLNVLTIIAASGRVLDAITDPLIANWSDRYDSPKGRRLPFMKWSALPAALFCALMFFPLVSEVSTMNTIWLFVTQALFYISITFYVTPYFALIPELGHTTNVRLNMSTYISITYALGIMLASQVPLIGGMVGNVFGWTNPEQVFQCGVVVLCCLSVVMMLWPTWFLDEKKYSKGTQSAIPIKEALQHTFRNKYFKYYVIADFSYFTGLTIVMTGLLYFITILLQLEETMMGILLPVMVLVSFLFYPIVNILAKRVGKKRLMVVAMLFMSLIFLASYFLGRLPFSNTTQAFALILCFAIPMAFLGILPNAVLADVAEYDAQQTGIRQEGMFFAARTLMQKIGQSFGVFIFALLTTFGKDIGDDWGIRLSGIFGFFLCFLAGMYFTRFNEKELLNGLKEQD